MRFFISLLLLFPVNTFALPQEGQKIMISAATPEAVEAGKRIAREGGNAIDVAVGVALTLAVTSPMNAPFGGGGFAMVKAGKEVHALDFREMAPQKTNPDYYKNKAETATTDGGAAVGVPGVAAGLWELHQKYGKMKWEKLFNEALHYAKDGYFVFYELSSTLEEEKDRLDKNTQKYYFKNGKPKISGDLVVQKDLYNFLNLYKQQGPKAFYSGVVAQDLVNTVTKSGGDMTLEDLKNYKVRWLEPIKTQFEGYTLNLMPPPSSSGVVLRTAFKLMEELKLKNYKPLSLDELHLLGEIMSRSFRARALLGDPDYNKNPLDEIFSDKYIHAMAKSIDLNSSKELKPLTKNEQILESNQTTNFSVMDNQNNAVAITTTLNGNFGSGVTTEKYGIILNNEMDDFATHPDKPNQFGLIQGEANKVQPGKRPLSSMSPTIVEKNGETIMAIGAPGGPTIINGVLQATYRVLVSKYDMDMAIQTPRLHHQFLPNILFVDKDRLPPETLEGLQKRGHKIDYRTPSLVYGVRKNERGLLEGAFDARGPGAAGGF